MHDNQGFCIAVYQPCNMELHRRMAVALLEAQVGPVIQGSQRVTTYERCTQMRAGDQAWRAGLLQLPVPALTEGSHHRMAVHLLCSRPDDVTIEARLGSDTEASQRSPTRATADDFSEVRHLSSVI